MPSFHTMRQIEPDDRPMQPLGRPERLAPQETPKTPAPKPVPGKPHLLESADGKLQTNVPTPPSAWFSDRQMQIKDEPMSTVAGWGHWPLAETTRVPPKEFTHATYKMQLGASELASAISSGLLNEELALLIATNKVWQRLYAEELAQNAHQQELPRPNEPASKIPEGEKSINRAQAITDALAKRWTAEQDQAFWEARYYGPSLGHMPADDGQFGTTTGRMSSSKPHFEGISPKDFKRVRP